MELQNFDEPPNLDGDSNIPDKVLVQQLQMEVRSLRRVVDNCNTRIGAAHFSESMLKEKMAKMVVSIRDKAESSALFSNIANQSTYSRGALSVLIYNDMLENYDKSTNKPIKITTSPPRTSQHSASEQHSEGSSSPKKHSGSNLKKSNSVKKEHVVVKEHKPTKGVVASSNESSMTKSQEEELLKLSLALERASRERDELSKKLNKSNELLAISNAENKELNKRLNYLNNEFSILRGKQDMGTGVTTTGQPPGKVTDEGQSTTSDATWAGMLLMALWGVVAALNESEINRKIEQDKRTQEDDAITGNAIVRQMRRLHQSVRVRFGSNVTSAHESVARRNEAKHRLLKSQRNVNQGNFTFKSNNSNLSDVSYEDDASSGSRSRLINRNNNSIASQDSPNKSVRFQRHASTSDIMMINAKQGRNGSGAGGQSDGIQPFNVADIPSPQGLKWGGATAGIAQPVSKSIMEGRGERLSAEQIDAFGVTEIDEGPPKPIKGPNVKREMVKFA